MLRFLELRNPHLKTLSLGMLWVSSVLLLFWFFRMLGTHDVLSFELAALLIIPSGVLCLSFFRSAAASATSLTKSEQAAIDALGNALGASAHGRKLSWKYDNAPHQLEYISRESLVGPEVRLYRAGVRLPKFTIRRKQTEESLKSCLATGDEHFDSRFIVEADTRAAMKTLLSSSKVRMLIGKIISEPFTSIESSGRQLSLIAPINLDTAAMHAVVFNRKLGFLRDLKEHALKMKVTARPSGFSQITKSIPAVLALALSLYLYLGALRVAQPLSMLEPLLLALALLVSLEISIYALCVYRSVAVSFITRASRFTKLCSASSLLFVCLAGVLLVNSALDQTNRSERLVYVNSASDQALRCVIGVARSQGGETSEHVYTNRDVCLEPDVGNAVMMLTTRRGHFTFEWIDSAELMSWSHNGQE